MSDYAYSFSTRIDLEITVTVSGVIKTLYASDALVSADYNISGKYYPATQEEPEEHPELELGDVTLDGPAAFFDDEDRLVLTLPDGHVLDKDLTRGQIKGLEQRAWEEHGEAADFGDHGDYLYDAFKDAYPMPAFPALLKVQAA